MILHRDSPYYEGFKNAYFKTETGCGYRISWLYVARLVLWRFLEISNRIGLALLIWINVGGTALLIIMGVEFAACFILCCGERAYVPIYTQSISMIIFDDK